MKRDPRSEELLVARALYGLDDADMVELRALGGEDEEGFDQAAAALDLALTRPEPLPGALVERILASAPRPGPTPLRPPHAPASPMAPARMRTARTLPAWLVAAAGVALAIGAWTWAMSRPTTSARVAESAPSISVSASASARAPDTGVTPSASEGRQRLLAEAEDVRQIRWRTTKDLAAVGAAGDVVWSTAAQRGYMRFDGLAPNDPTRAQYQLWIFDADRDAKYPVDGGVFDVSSSGEVIVPIVAKLHVDRPTLFAITVEKPGGVVVSKRERIVLTAPASPG